MISVGASPYPDEVIDRLARAFYPAILACWNSKEGQREFAAWQAEQTHHAPSKEKQSVPDGERPVVHIVIVCGFWQGASGWAHPIFYFNVLVTFQYISKSLMLIVFLTCFSLFCTIFIFTIVRNISFHCFCAFKVQSNIPFI